MALVSANNVACIAASIIMPIFGVWSADLILDQPDGSGFEAGTQVTIRCDGGLDFVGVVVPDRTGSFLDSVHVRVLGGAGGMAKAATVQGYNQPGALVRNVLNQLASDSGETLSSDITQDFLGTNLSAWATLEGTVSAALKQVIDIILPDANWRMGADGKLFVGVETWPSSSDAYEIIASDPTQATYDLAVDAFTVVPGVSIDGIGKINRVEHTVQSNAVRSKVWVQVSDEDRGVAGSIQSLARQEVARVDFFALYDAKVVKQSADGKLVDLQPGDSRIPKLSNVPVRNGLANTVCKFAPGATMRLGWDRGNPQFPFAALYQGGENVIEINIAEGNKGAARVDDPISTAAALTTWAQAVEMFINGLAPGTITVLWAAGAGLPGALAKIYQGSNKVKVGG